MRPAEPEAPGVRGDAASGAPRRPVARWFLIFIAVSLVARGISFLIPIIDKDEACYMVGAREILRGRLLYVDFADQHPPGAYLFYAGTQAVTGLGMLGVRLVATLLIVPLTALAASAFFRHDRRGLVAGLLYIIFGAAFAGHDMLSVNCELLMALPLAWAAVLLRDETWAARWTHAGAAGLLTGLAAVIKYQSALWGPVFAIVVLLAAGRRRELHRVPGRWAALAAGFALPIVATWAWWAARGAGAEFLYWNVTHNLSYVTAEMSPREAWGKAFSYFAPFLLVTAPLWWASIRSLRDAPGEHGRRMAALLILFTIPAAVFGLRFYPHYFVQLYWPLAVGAAPVAAALLGWPLRRAGVLAAVYPALLWAAFTASAADKYLVRVGAMEETRPVFREVAAYLRGDPCYAGANMFVWGYAPSFYYEAGLPVAGRFIMTQVGLTGYVSGNLRSVTPGFDPKDLILPEHWDLLMGDLARNRPTYFLDTAPSGIRHWNMFPLSRYPRLESFVAENYEQIAEVERVAIYRRKGCAAK